MNPLQTLSRINLVLRIGLGLVWLWSALVSEFFAPRAVTLGLLADVGITGPLAEPVLHAASALDALVGVLTLAGVAMRPLALAQAAIITGYTILLVGRVPDLWAHPFAPIGKNIALVAAALALALVSGRPARN
ncbi:MAG: DoxX-like family protein [Chloroflexi bacterium]|nr:DoxX-like family protein [Chloroflexota bacterium]